MMGLGPVGGTSLPISRPLCHSKESESCLSPAGQDPMDKAALCRGLPGTLGPQHGVAECWPAGPCSVSESQDIHVGTGRDCF